MATIEIEDRVFLMADDETGVALAQRARVSELLGRLGEGVDVIDALCHELQAARRSYDAQRAQRIRSDENFRIAVQDSQRRADAAMPIYDENAQLLRENAQLRRRLETFERKAKKPQSPTVAWRSGIATGVMR